MAKYPAAQELSIGLSCAYYVVHAPNVLADPAFPAVPAAGALPARVMLLAPVIQWHHHRPFH
jgi:hypothetical protein